MKVLFLDFDGVLNIWPAPSRSGVFHKLSCLNLDFLLNKVPDLKIVVSSSWRTFGLEAVRDVLKSNGIDPRKVIDITGHEDAPNAWNHRGFQVQKWLERHPDVKGFAILDDESDFEPLLHKLVKTDRFTGLTQTNVEKVMEILGE